MKTLMIATLLARTLLGISGELSDYYYEQTKGKQVGFGSHRSYDEMMSTNHGLTQIAIERTSCFGTCPSYTFIVKSDGTFRYQGQNHVERKGEFTGRIPDWDYNALAWFIKDSGYMALEEDYFATVTDSPTVYTMVILNGKRKCIRNYANAGPTKLWAIEQLIDDLMSKAKWDAPQKELKKNH